MADPGAGRHHAEVLERTLAPAQERIPLAIAAELGVHVFMQRIGCAGDVDHDRVVDHQVHRHQRVHLLRPSAERGDAVPHGSEVHDAGHAGEVLHQDAGRLERDFLVGMPLLRPLRDRPRILDRVAGAVFEAQHVFQKYFQADRQPSRTLVQRLGRLNHGEIIILDPRHVQRTTGVEGIVPNRLHGGVSPVV